MNMKRPRAITVIAWLNIFDGAASLLTQWEFLVSPSQLREPLSTIGSTIPLYLFQTGFISIALVASGIGLLAAKSWSWWVSVVLQGNAIVFAIYSLVVIGAAMPLIYQLKQLIPLAISILILVYLLKNTALDFFGVRKPNIKSLLGYAFSANLSVVILLGMAHV